MSKLYQLLHVKALRTSPYHPKTDGLVERFNATLKEMLWKSAQEDGKDWDKLIPYVLFAYREVPQESTGFAPFELLYGRDIRGPLDILKDEWESSPKSDQSVISHILLMRDRLEQMSALAQENLWLTQTQQKAWYNRTAKERTLKPGDRVLVLLPTASSKLLAQWQGPYEVVKLVGKANYLVEMHDRQKRKVLHVNMLKKWNEPVSSGYFVSEAANGEEEMKVWTSDGGEDGEPIVGSQLTANQTSDLTDLLKRHRWSLTKTPGCISITVHKIDSEDSAPIHLPPHRLHHAYWELVKKELAEMQAHGVIAPASSNWAAPMVIVHKKDGTIRLCVDYRRLNVVSRVDDYPMPCIDDLIDLLGQARFISTLDLTKEYG